jgi:hypothetical protein
MALDSSTDVKMRNFLGAASDCRRAIEQKNRSASGVREVMMSEVTVKRARLLAKCGVEPLSVNYAAHIEAADSEI